jgi:hypothetical protein
VSRAIGYWNDLATFVSLHDYGFYRHCAPMIHIFSANDDSIGCIKSEYDTHSDDRGGMAAAIGLCERAKFRWLCSMMQKFAASLGSNRNNPHSSARLRVGNTPQRFFTVRRTRKTYTWPVHHFHSRLIALVSVISCPGLLEDQSPR